MRGTFLLMAGLPLLLSACSGSGFYRYARDTATFPGANPNKPVLSSANYQRVLHKGGEQPVLLTETGDIWPGPPGAIPTLKDLQRQQREVMANGGTGAGSPEALRPLPSLPSLPGYEISEPQPPHVAPPTSFPRGLVAMPSTGPAPTTGVTTLQEGPNGAIIVPNGNGTVTIINPNGSVTTAPATTRAAPVHKP